MSKPKRQALGRGLGALLPSANKKLAPVAAPAPPAASDSDAREGLRTLGIERLTPNPDQPRKHFDPKQLEELSNSIRNQGLLQPIVVTPLDEDASPKRYLIIAGERRWRAAQLAGVHQVSVVIKEIAEDDRLELALVENIQRADLSPIEEAQAYRELISLREYTQEELAHRVGKERSTVTNALRLLRLPAKVQSMLQVGRLSMGHARALLGLPHEDDINSLAAEVTRANMSVRATESAVRKRLSAASPKEPTDEDARRKIIVGELEMRLRRRLGARVRLRSGGKKGKGTMEIPYASLDELDRLLRVILDD